MDGDNVTLDVFCEFLDARDYRYELSSDGPSLRMGFLGINAVLSVMIALQNEPMRLDVIVQMPSVVPEERRREMAEAIVRINGLLALGCFHLDMNDGTMECRAIMPIADATITAEQWVAFDALLHCPVIAADYFYPAFSRLLFGDDLSPAEVVAEINMSECDFDPECENPSRE